jgi:hypothetical protein
MTYHENLFSGWIVVCGHMDATKLLFVILLAFVAIVPKRRCCLSYTFSGKIREMLVYKFRCRRWILIWSVIPILLITVAAQSKAWNVFARSNIGIVDWNPTQGMGVCLRLFCVCVRKRPCDGVIPRSRSPTDCLRLRNWSETKRFTDALCNRNRARGIPILKLKFLLWLFDVDTG